MQPITIRTENATYTPVTFTFSGGELQVKIPNLPEFIDDHVQIEARLQSSDDLVQLLLVNEIITRQTNCSKSVTLVLPYFPYARQDRMMERTEAFSLKAIAPIINGMGFDTITIVDPHSDVVPALLTNVEVIDQSKVFFAHEKLGGFLDWASTVLVSPDAGAAKKAFKIAQLTGMPLITATKHRNVLTGEITATTINKPEFIAGKDILIVDDICDGGRTFIELAKVIRSYNPRNISLFVTHSIFSKGINVFDGVIDQVFTTDSFQSERLLSMAYPLFVKSLNFSMGGELS